MSNVTTLIIMAKEPRPGHVKTRLSPPLKPTEAADLAAAFLLDLTARLLGIPGARVEVALPPGDSPDALRTRLDPSVRFADQGEGALGERLTFVLDRAFGQGAKVAMVIGSDHPNLPLSYVRAVIAAARAGGVGWVPTRDGGYACMGLPRRLPGLFEGIPWSTPTVGETTRNRAVELGVSLEAPGTWYDVDTIADLRHLRADPDTRRRCPHTWAALQRLRETRDE